MSARDEVLRAVARRRWLLAAGLAAAAVATGLPALAPTPAATTRVLAAARDLSAGTALRAEDLTPVDLPGAAVPDGALTSSASLAGRLLAAPVRRGEPLTDVRVVGPGLLAAVGDRDLVAVPVRLADPAAGALLRPGDRVDVLAAAPDGTSGSADVVASGSPVLAVPSPAGDLDGALVLLAAPPAVAGRLAAAAVGSRLSVVVRP